MKLSAATGFLCLSLIAASVAPAAALTFTESGDITGSLGNPFLVGTLDTGLNIISGSVSTECSLVIDDIRECYYFSSPETGDAVSFLIADGASLTSATATISNLSTDSSGTLSVRARSFTALDYLGLVGAGTFDILSGGPLSGNQNYQFAPRLLDAAGGDTVSFDWSLSLTVEEARVVPLPATLPLLLGALGLAFAATRRRA